MPRRSSPSDGFDSREIDAAINASVIGFQKLSRRAQLVVIVLLTCCAIVAGVLYWRYQQTLQTPPIVENVNLLLGNPSGANAGDRDNYLMVKPYYVLSYNNQKGTPNWVSWQVTTADLGDAPRKQIFDSDPELPAGFNVVKTSDYSGSGFDRGHMCPHSDRAANTDMSYSTFVMTNIIPQAPSVNQKAWAQFEVYCRDLVKAYNHLYVISGPYGEGGTGSRGSKRALVKGAMVTVPSECWKVVVVVPEGGVSDDLAKVDSSTRVIAIDMPNDNTAVGEAWDIYRTTPAAIELKTGYHFFDKLRPDVAGGLRQKLDDKPISPPRPMSHEREAG
ncbi:MAG TPA: DNA/RNA non-specific endonuclease [Tepidisphaeraceae bacterium]|jgi:endonuclease G